MSVDLLELGHSALGELVAEVVFVGGATVVLWITDPGDRDDLDTPIGTLRAQFPGSSSAGVRWRGR